MLQHTTNRGIKIVDAHAYKRYLKMCGNSRGDCKAEDVRIVQRRRMDTVPRESERVIASSIKYRLVLMIFYDCDDR
jgi:hypothetical protein